MRSTGPYGRSHRECGWQRSAMAYNSQERRTHDQEALVRALSEMLADARVGRKKHCARSLANPTNSLDATSGVRRWIGG
jgi:hypothetical protein